MVNVPRLKGVHYAIDRDGSPPRPRSARCSAAKTPARSALSSYDEAVRDSFIWSDLHEVRNMRQVFGRGFFVGGALASAMTMSKGRVEVGEDGRRSRTPTAAPLVTDRDSSYQTPDGKLTFDKLSSSLRLGQQGARRPAEPHPDRSGRVPREVAQLWAHMCPAQVYETGREDADGTVTVDLAPSNCVQCGAITAKGGRLTPPEGGSGPEYTRT